MKKNTLSVIALILAVISLAVSVFTALAVWDMADRYDAQLDWMNEKYLHLESRLSSITGSVETPPRDADTPAACDHYGNLIIGDWSFADNALTISSAFAQVMAGPDITLNTARTVLYVNGESRHALSQAMHEGEASDSYELDLEETRFELAEQADGDMVELYLDVTLSDGCSLSVCGGSWEYLEGNLLMIAG